jgi:excisionase family DNA binding protein
MAFEQFRGRIMSPETVAESTDSSISNVHRWISSGKIKAVKIGYRMTRIDGDSLADFLTSRLSAPRPARGKNLKQSVANSAA